MVGCVVEKMDGSIGRQIDMVNKYIDEQKNRKINRQVDMQIDIYESRKIVGQIDIYKDR